MYAQVGKNAPIVQKYGGTSVGDAQRIKTVASRIARQWRSGYRQLAVVVSARAGETNRLVELVNEVNPRASGLTYDMAVAAGEQVSVALLAAALEAEGIEAQPFLAYKLGIFTDDLHAKARIRYINTEPIRRGWERGAIAVIAGFQGITEEMELTTLGRGGSDTSAVALAVALRAGFCEINTDVDGVFTADPRLVAKARLIEKLDYETAFEMASLGSKVLHPRCVELGAKFQLPITVRNTFTPDDHPRTRIMPFSESDVIEALVVSGVTTDRSVAKFTVSGLEAGTNAIAAIFQSLGTLGVNVDIIVHDRPEKDALLRLGFTVARGDVAATRLAMQKLASECGFETVQVETEEGLAKVSAVGVGMRSYAGVAGRAFRSLSAANIVIHMISTSEIKISVVVDEADAERATQVLHREFMEAEG